LEFLTTILDPKQPFFENEAQVIRATERWDDCETELDEWAKDITEEQWNAMPLLAMERMQSLLMWTQVPPTSFTSQENQALHENVEDVRAHSLGYRCKKCGRPAIVTSGGGKNAVKRYLRCQDRNCGWRGAAAKKTL
jgi:hypothetical protein